MAPQTTHPHNKSRIIQVFCASPKSLGRNAFYKLIKAGEGDDRLIVPYASFPPQINPRRLPMYVKLMIPMILMAAAAVPAASAQTRKDKQVKAAPPATSAAVNPNLLRPFGPITAITNPNATASKPGKTVTFRIVPPNPGDEQPRPGQHILLSIDGKTAAYTQFPLRVPNAKNCVGEGTGHGCFRMETKDAKVSNTGLITGKTHTISEDVIEGFTGQVWVHLMDRNGNPIMIRRAGCYGVNMRQGRDDVWSVQVPKDSVGMVSIAEIWHARSGCGRDRWNEVLDKAKKGAEVIGALMKASTQDSTSTTEPKQ
jgi:hypothetical protein